MTKKTMFKNITGIILVSAVVTTAVFADAEPKMTIALKNANSASDIHKILNRYLNYRQNFSSNRVIYFTDDKRNSIKMENMENKPEDLYSLLGMSENDYINALASGKTLKSLLKEKGVVEQYKNLLVEQYSKTLDVAVKNSSITESDKTSLIEKYNIALVNDDIFNDTELNVASEDPVLQMLNLNMSEYKQKLKDGETLTSLILKRNKTEEFKKYKERQFSDTLDFAISCGSISQNEADSLRTKYATAL